MHAFLAGPGLGNLVDHVHAVDHLAEHAVAGIGSATIQAIVVDEIDEELCWPRVYLPSQGEFQGLTTRFKGFSGPVGSGKSAALCFEVVRQCYVNRGRRGVLAAPTLGMLRDATLAGLYEVLEAEEINYQLHKTDGELTFTAPGSTA